MKKFYIALTFLFATFSVFANPAPVEEAFQFRTKLIDPNSFRLEWDVKFGYFLYKEKILLHEQPEDNFHLGELRYPPYIKKTDGLGKTYLIYRDKLILAVPLLGLQAGESLLDIHYQGCSDDGFCYPPQTKHVKLTIDKNLSLTDASIEDEAPISAAPTPSPTDEVEQVFSSDSWILIVLSFFGFGLLLAFTPCVLPMIPIISGIIVGHGNDLSTRKAFFLSLSYVLSMSFTYAVVGAIVALMGNNLQITMQSPWAIGIFSSIFVLLSLSMFNVYELRLPLSWQSKLAKVTRGQSSGHYIGAAIMGSLSTLILSPCVTAPLIGALGYIAHTGNIILGSVALFFLGLGMGTPLLLIGTSAGKLLPKAGRWMNGVKIFFGIVLLAMAVYLLSRILPAVVVMVLWSCLLIFSGVYLGALTRSRNNAAKFMQASGIILLVYGLLILIGASKGGTNPLQPLAMHQEANVTRPPGTKVARTIAELNNAIKDSQGKPILLDFYADWCASCKVIAATTLQSPQVLDALSHVLVIKIDLTANNLDAKELLRHFNVVAPPSFLFIDSTGKERLNLRLVGEIAGERLIENLNQIKAQPN